MNENAVFVSKLAAEFKQNICLKTHEQEDSEYSNSFDGKHAIDVLVEITQSNDRSLAIIMGRALGGICVFNKPSISFMMLRGRRSCKIQQMPFTN